MIKEIIIGKRLKCLRAFQGIPVGTEGIIIEDYGTGITVAWDLPGKPLPEKQTPKRLAKMSALVPWCPLRDGFDKKSELKYLEYV